jgi:plasmid stabilization system protein ParE
MTPRYVLAPQAALDLVEIWQFLKEHAGVTAADRVESAMLERIGFLAGAT